MIDNYHVPVKSGIAKIAVAAIKFKHKKYEGIKDYTCSAIENGYPIEANFIKFSTTGDWLIRFSTQYNPNHFKEENMHVR